MKTNAPQRGIDWDVFEYSCDEFDAPVLQVQRVDETDSMNDDEAVECARKSGIDCDDRGFVISMGENE